MIKTLNCTQKNYQLKLNKLLSKRQIGVKFNENIVNKIISDVKKSGDKALIKYEKKYSKNTELASIKKKITKSIKSLDPKIKKAIDFSYNRIFKFHSKQKVQNISYKDNLNNKLYYKYIPIDSIGIYVPGGNASFPSTVLMNAIPAKIAGVKRIVMVNPKLKGQQSPAVLYAAKKVRIKEIYPLGGAQAIAALAYGTKKIIKVNKIVGPGNVFVSTAKKKVFGEKNLEEAPAFSSPEAKQHVDKDLILMSKYLGKASQQVIKTMMSGVKSGKYDAMDLARGIQTGPTKRTHYGEADFIQQLWNKVRDGFRRYSKRGKLR